MSKVYALVDCNSFFVSCERLFRPELINTPVGVLSNNDGCFISLSRELKSLGVPMGTPYFKVRTICKKNKVTVFSSNFALYSNLSNRVMKTLAQFTPRMEIYSIDEAFLDLTGFKDIHCYAKFIKKKVEKDTGIPVSIGVSTSKTLAKLANNMAKKTKRTNGVVVLLDQQSQDVALHNTPIGKVWGVGRALDVDMQLMGLYTAKDLRDYKNSAHIKKKYTKVGLQIKEELQGHERFTLEQTVKPKKSIMCSRSFGSSVYRLEDLRKAVANYMSSAFETLRKQNSTCGEIGVFIRTSRHKKGHIYRGSNHIKLLSPTSDSRKAVGYGFEILNRIYKKGYEYKKAGVYLGKLQQEGNKQLSLFENYDNERSLKLMKTIDVINHREGKGAIKLAACGIDNKSWAMNRNFLSPRYVSGWSQLLKVK